jgi:hypothetical protein
LLLLTGWRYSPELALVLPLPCSTSTLQC